MLPLLEKRALDLILLSNFASSLLLLFNVWHAHYSQIDYHGRAGHTADLSALKDHIHNWISDVALEIMGEDEPVILSPRCDGVFSKNRGDWGWNSLWSAQLLVKRSAQDEFDQDPEGYQEGLRHAKKKSNHTTLPSFLYAEYLGVPGDPLRYLFRSPLLMQVSIPVDITMTVTAIPDGGNTGLSMYLDQPGLRNKGGRHRGHRACLDLNGIKFFDKVVDLLNSNGLGKSVLAYFIGHVYGATTVDEEDDELDNKFESLKRALAAWDAGSDPSGNKAVA
ncbi:hypothetical protein NUW54_g555 [Trametes sanguinea]|uniref:Uncharacterized protein n=2 Tax=Trametes sanguinea TaxID=158606 RepID=A0ACC1QBL0_9APHY|nr:hypothetical protein NUW54_g1442 [Trametes sanguinea]KAJ3017549.1 hypothetical protein NUW54_g555 [Trametes sanguinea]